MEVLDSLQQRLSAINQLSLSRIRPGDSLAMMEEKSRLSAMVSGVHKLDETALSSIDDVLKAFFENLYLTGFRQVRLACFGCTQATGQDSRRLIESRTHFEKLLDYVGHYQDSRRSFRKLYRGLLSAYFSYDPASLDANMNGRANWNRLRDFLRMHLESFVIGEFTPDWLAVLAKYPGLLSEHPGQAVGILNGDWSVFDEVRERLELDSGSWLVKQLVLTQVAECERMDDAHFREQLDGVLLLLHDYPLYASDGLKTLLDRYARCADSAMHPHLRDFSVDLWGNPWRPDNAHQWLCGSDARAMLAHWLKRLLLREFFSLLSNDDRAHARRFNFWDLYSEDMNGMYFALGRDAYAPGNMPLFKFRKHAKGLLAKLTDEKHGVHTCIMQFDHHHVVELNRENNVAYFYDARQGIPAFYFAKGWVDVGAIGVNDIAEGANVSRVSTPLRHQDSKEMAWEGGFAEALGMTENAMKAFCRKYQCSYEDLRVRDGSEWVKPADVSKYGADVWSVLMGWGFCYSVEKRAYYRFTYPKLN